MFCRVMLCSPLITTMKGANGSALGEAIGGNGEM